MTADAALWENPQSAQKLMSEKNNLEYALGNFREMMQNLNDLAELAELAEAENDEAVLVDVTQQLETLRETVKHSELEALLDPIRFTGRSVEQVEEYIAGIVDPVLKKYQKDLGETVEISV